LARIEIDTQPARGKETDVGSTSGEILGNLSINVQAVLRLAVFADSLNALDVGAPFDPGLRIFSPDPAAMRFFLALML